MKGNSHAVHQAGSTLLLKVFQQRVSMTGPGEPWSKLVLSLLSPPSMSRLWGAQLRENSQDKDYKADGNFLIAIIAASH